MAQKNLSIKLSLNDKQFQSSLRKATRRMKKFGTSMKRTGQTLSRNLTLPLLAFGAASIAAFDKQAKAIAQDQNLTEEAELTNGRFAMIGIIAALGAYVTTGNIIPGIF